MKKFLAILFAVAVITYAFAAGTLPVTIAWTCNQSDGASNYVFNVYVSPTPTPNGVLLTNVVGVTNCSLTIQRPSDQYLYVTVIDPRSSSTNYVAESEPSNIIRIRVLGNGTLRVNQ